MLTTAFSYVALCLVYATVYHPVASAIGAVALLACVVLFDYVAFTMPVRRAIARRRYAKNT